jgi:hypothetical protein
MPRMLLTSVLLTGAVLLAACGSSSGESSGAAAPAGVGPTPVLNMVTATCADVMQAANPPAGEKAALKIMAATEGLTVTTAMENAFITDINDRCAANPTSLFALLASDAYVDVR